MYYGKVHNTIYCTLKGLWQTNGKTPAATIYAAITCDIATKGDASRFVKTDRGRVSNQCGLGAARQGLVPRGLPADPARLQCKHTESLRPPGAS